MYWVNYAEDLVSIVQAQGTEKVLRSHETKDAKIPQTAGSPYQSWWNGQTEGWISICYSNEMISNEIQSMRVVSNCSCRKNWRTTCKMCFGIHSSEITQKRSEHCNPGLWAAFWSSIRNALTCTCVCFAVEVSWGKPPVICEWTWEQVERGHCEETIRWAQDQSPLVCQLLWIVPFHSTLAKKVHTNLYSRLGALELSPWVMWGSFQFYVFLTLCSWLTLHQFSSQASYVQVDYFNGYQQLMYFTDRAQLESHSFCLFSDLPQSNASPPNSFNAAMSDAVSHHSKVGYAIIMIFTSF